MMALRHKRSKATTTTSDPDSVTPNDSEFQECVLDFLLLFSDEELESDGPLLKRYVQELLLRWGRWTAKGRPPHQCFAAAALGGMKLLEKHGLKASERTERIERAVANCMAGVTVDALEPGASAAMRSKAIILLADEVCLFFCDYFSLSKKT